MAGSIPTNEVSIAMRERRTLSVHAAKGILFSLISSHDPVQCLLELEGKLDDVAQFLLPKKDTQSENILEVFKGSSMVVGGSFAFWAGFIFSGQLLLPVVSTVIGTIGVVKVFKGLFQWKDSGEKLEFFKVFYTCLRVMERIDNLSSEQETKIREILLSSLPLTVKERRVLESLKAEKIDDLQIPDWLSQEQKKSILNGCWSMLYSDGLTNEEDQGYNLLAEKLKIPQEEVAKMKKEVEISMDEQDDILLRIGTLAHFLYSEDSLERITKTLLPLAVKKESGDQLLKAIQSRITEENQGTKDALDHPFPMTIASSAYFLCRTMTEVIPEAGAVSKERYQKLCKLLERSLDGQKFIEQAEIIYTSLMQKLQNIMRNPEY